MIVLQSHSLKMQADFGTYAFQDVLWTLTNPQYTDTYREKGPIYFNRCTLLIQALGFLSHFHDT